MGDVAGDQSGRKQFGQAEGDFAVHTLEVGELEACTGEVEQLRVDPRQAGRLEVHASEVEQLPSEVEQLQVDAREVGRLDDAREVGELEVDAAAAEQREVGATERGR
jgi:hypothetical protein